MKEINFKAWDKELKEMLEMDIRENGVWFGSCNKFEDILLYPERFELMQFTGLTDCKGKEIFGGDIVKSEVGRLYEVAMNGWSWRQKHIPSGWWRDWKPEIEVIGNIFENLELLKKAKEGL